MRLQMPFQQPLPGKLFVTDVAAERFAARVVIQVILECGGGVAREVALVTVEELVSGVCAHVRVQAVARLGLELALAAGVRFLLRVSLHVLLDETAVGTPVVADRAGVRLLASMRPGVLLQVSRLLELLLADRTLVRSFSRVDTDVFGEAAPVSATEGTIVALVTVLCVVSASVSSPPGQFTGLVFTLVAAVQVTFHVGFSVRLELRIRVSFIITH